MTLFVGDAKAYGGVSNYDFTTKTGFENLDYLNRTADFKR